jgi:hypothetical protein
LVRFFSPFPSSASLKGLQSSKQDIYKYKIS